MAVDRDAFISANCGCKCILANFKKVSKSGTALSRSGKSNTFHSQATTKTYHSYHISFFEKHPAVIICATYSFFEEAAGILVTGFRLPGNSTGNW